MAQKIIFKIMFIILILVSACTDLNEKFYNVVTPETYGKTGSEIATIVGGAYVTLRGYSLDKHWATEFLWYLDEVSSDEAVIPTRGTDWLDGGIHIQIQTHTWTYDNEIIRRAWEYSYSAISKINIIINTIDNANLTEDEKDNIKAELRGLRAYYYFLLCDWFGNVPLIIDFADKDLKTNSSRTDVYNFIESELLDIVNLLPSTGYAKFNKNVAYGLLARLYLNAGVFKGEPEWQKCINACDKVTGYFLEPNFFTNFLQINEGSVENIFVIPYDKTTTRGENYQQALTLHYNQSLASGYRGTSVNGISAEPGVYSKFDDNDKRKACMIEGLQINRTTGQEILMASGSPLNYTENISSLNNAAQNEGVRDVKYQITDGDIWNDSDCDYVLMRYSEILLMKAEALIRLGSPELARPLIDLVRQRAGLETPSVVDLDFLYDELLREFLWESHRRRDNIRFGKFGDMGWGWTEPANGKYLELFPIPKVALVANSKLVQNPGY